MKTSQLVGHLNMNKKFSVIILLFFIVWCETSVGSGTENFRQQLSGYLRDVGKLTRQKRYTADDNANIERGETEENIDSPSEYFSSCTSRFLFQCEFEDKCIPYMFTCDGTNDCLHASDEKLQQCRDHRPNMNAIKAKYIGKHNMTVEWDAYMGTYVPYIFSYVTKIHGAYSETNASVVTNSYTLRHLHPAQTYYLNVYVSNSTYVWRPYGKIKITTLDDYPNEPELVNAYYDQNTDRVTVDWQPPFIYKGKIVKYRVYVYEPKNRNAYYQDAINEKQWELILDPVELGLHFSKGTTYKIKVSAFTSEGEGQKSDSATVVYGSSCLLSYVRNFNATAKGNNSIELKWNPSRSQVDGYKVYYYDLWDVKRELHTKDGNTTSLTVDNLCSGTSYYFDVVPEKQGCTGGDLYIAGMTNGTQLGSIIVRAEAINATSVNVSWTVPEGSIPNEDTTPSKTEGEIHTQAWSGVLFHSAWTAGDGIPGPAPQARALHYDPDPRPPERQAAAPTEPEQQE